MAAPGYEVDRAQLDTHAGQVTDFAARVGLAKDAVDQVGLGGTDSYGLLCSPLMIPALQGFQGNSGELVSSAAELAGALADALRRTTAGYGELENRVSDQLRQTGEQR